MDFLLLVVGFVFLIKGADLLVGSASKLAKILGVPAFIVGLTVVAFGTSAPEAVIGIFSGIKHTNAITLGDVIGSSIVNIALIIGLTAVVLPIKVERSVAIREIPFSGAIQLLLVVMIAIGGRISRIDGVFLLLVFSLFIYYISVRSKKSSEADAAEVSTSEEIQEEMQAEMQDNLEVILQDGTQTDSPDSSSSGSAVHEKNDAALSENKKTFLEHRNRILKLVGLLAAGLAGMVAGGNLVVESSVNIAHRFGLNETLIGLTIVALGTSLPELVTCLIAALKKEDDIALGNIIGSNIFNVVFVLGLSTLINPIPAAGVGVDIAVMIASTLFVFAFGLFMKKIPRTGGVALILFYAVYIVYKVVTI